MSTRATLAAELETRLGDPTNVIWSEAELKSYIDYAIKGLYPTFFRYNVNTTTATVGPIQTAPAGARNLHMVGLKRAASTRVRPLRGWQEGNGEAFVSKTGITGDVLVWAWTSGWDAPATDVEALTIPQEAEEYVLVRCHIVALERLLSDRVSLDRYFSLNVRQAASEADIADQIDSLRGHLNDLTANRLPLPEKRQ